MPTIWRRSLVGGRHTLYDRYIERLNKWTNQAYSPSRKLAHTHTQAYTKNKNERNIPNLQYTRACSTLELDIYRNIYGLLGNSGFICIGQGVSADIFLSADCRTISYCTNFIYSRTNSLDKMGMVYGQYESGGYSWTRLGERWSRDVIDAFIRFYYIVVIVSEMRIYCSFWFLYWREFCRTTPPSVI